MRLLSAVLAAAEYRHIKFRGGILTLRGLIWGLWGGFAAGLLITYYHKVYLGETVRRLLKRGATSPETALTLPELGQKLVWMRKRALRPGGSLQKYLMYVAPGTAEDGREPVLTRKISDFSETKLFIPEEKKHVAAVRYGERKKTSPLWLIVFLAVLTALAVALTIALPELLTMIDNAITQYFD